MFSVQLTPPASEPLTLQQAKEYLRVDTSHENDLITSLIAAGRNWAETYLRRALLEQTWRYYIPSFVDQIMLPVGGVQSITSITYIDTLGATITLPTTVYRLLPLNSMRPAMIIRDFNQIWPATRDQPDAVCITYVAGVATASLIPAEIITAIKQHVAWHFAHREPGSDFAAMQQALERSLVSHRMFTFK